MFPVIDSAASCPDHGPQGGMAEALPPPKGVAKAAYSSVESLLTLPATKPAVRRTVQHLPTGLARKWLRRRAAPRSDRKGEREEAFLTVLHSNTYL